MQLVRSCKKLAAGYFMKNGNRVFCFICGPGSGPRNALANMGSSYPITFFALVGSWTNTKKGERAVAGDSGQYIG